MAIPQGDENRGGRRYWYAIYTRPRFEKKVAQELSDSCIEVYLPIIQVTKVWSDRKKRISEPLFPSYLFVHANERERYDALQPVGSVRVVSFNGAPVRVPSEQIDSVRRMLETGHAPSVQNALRPGTAVEVATGSLAGLRGVVHEARGKYHFTVYIDGICQAVAVNIDASHLRVIDKEKLNSSYMRQMATDAGIDNQIA